MDEKGSKPIVVLGVGNILLKDEGVGVRVIERLQERYEFPQQVELVDGGVLGLGLLAVIKDAEHLIIIDAIRKNQEPGTLYRFTGDDIPMRVYPKTSLHQVDLVEALTIAEILWQRPETIVLGIEPLDTNPWRTELTPVIQAKIDELMNMTLEELKSLGVKWQLKDLEK
ncbi:MAG: HyaD/HybD family hydrogenase maturation endopeptidase [Desulfobacteria bacterium]|jgi:hydrogenase maturation protease